MRVLRRPGGRVNRDAASGAKAVINRRGRRSVGGRHLSFSQVVVDHREVEAQLLHVAFVALEEEEVAVHLRVQRRQVVDVDIGAGAQKLREEEAGKGQLHQHVLIQRLRNTKGHAKVELTEEMLVALNTQ